MNPPPDPGIPLYVVGPTAVGKSAVALALAERIGGEIISVDSMQVYRGLDIGTDKPDAAARSRVRHHLIDVVGLDATFDAARFVEMARAAETEIRSRGRIPVFCGGTGLYFKAWLDGLGESPPADPQLRAELEALPLETLIEELDSRDADAGAKIDRKNRRRIVRALEILRLTGRPIAAQQAVWRPAGTPEGPGPVIIGMARATEDLRARIDRRVAAMFAAGLVEETRQLLERGLDRNRTAMQALGYRQVVEHLRGERPLPDTVALVQQKTRQFAKRQMTWFRRQMAVRWIDLGRDSDPVAVADPIAALWKSPGFPAPAGVIPSET